MGLDDIAKGAALMIGAGIIAERFGAGPGLKGLGLGVREIAAAPLGGVGAGLKEFGAGVRSITDIFGDIAKGIGDIFGAIPRMPGPGGAGSGQLPPPITYTPLPIIPDIPGVIAPPRLIALSGPNAGGGTKNVMNMSKQPVLDPTKGLGRIYQVNGGLIGFRKAPHLTFTTRKQARNYLAAYEVGAPMEGTAL